MRFLKTYSGSDEDWSYSVQQTSDDWHIIAVEHILSVLIIRLFISSKTEGSEVVFAFGSNIAFFIFGYEQFVANSCN
ncbi:MAG: hypothetical protein FJ218_02300 [Ignavibacteria bacterium]|nr:hypothetical protein [Ignavibacteria bacterium]